MKLKVMSHQSAAIGQPADLPTIAGSGVASFDETPRNLDETALEAIGSSAC